MKSIGTLTGPWRSYWIAIVMVFGLGSCGAGAITSGVPVGWKIAICASTSIAALHVARSWWRAHVFSIY